MKVSKKAPGGEMHRDRYSELKSILEERRREIVSAVQGKIRDVFAELAGKFVPFSDVLSDISERTALASSNNDVLRIYEKWLRTGSQREGQRLVARGIVPNSSVGKRFLQ